MTFPEKAFPVSWDQVPPRRAGRWPGGLPSAKRGQVARHRVHHPGGLVPAAIIAPRMDHQADETACRPGSYHDYVEQGELEGAEGDHAGTASKTKAKTC